MRRTESVQNVLQKWSQCRIYTN